MIEGTKTTTQREVKTMKSYTVHLSNGHNLTLEGDELEMSDGSVLLRSGQDTYHFLRESILYWTVADGDLSDRQFKILGLMAAAKTNDAIARSLGFSESTIKQESMSIYRSLGVNSREEAVKVAVERDILRAVDIHQTP